MLNKKKNTLIDILLSDIADKSKQQQKKTYNIQKVN